MPVSLKRSCPAFLTLAFLALYPFRAFAACTSPAGNEGDVIYSSVSHALYYCNSTNWITMGSSSTVGFGTLTTNDFCTATSSTGIQCTTGYTGSGNVVLATSPTFASPTMTSPTVSSGGLAITAGGLTVSSGGATIMGTVTGTTFSGSGASLTNIGTSNMTAVTGTPSSTAFLRGDNTWATPSASLPALTNDYLWIGNGSNVATAVQMSGDCTIANTGAITCTKTNGASFGALATLSAAPAGTLTGTTLASNVVSSSLTGVGTITSGTWNGNGIGIGYGGTNATSQTTNGVSYFNGTSITTSTGFVYSGGQVGIGTSTPTATLTINGTEALQFGTNYTTTGTQNNVAISGNGSVRYTGTAAVTFNGIVAGANGQILYLHNGSNYTLTLANQSTSDTTYANQIVTGTGSNLSLAANGAAILQYDVTATNSNGASGAWRVIGGSVAGGVSGGTANYVPLWTSATTLGTSALYQSSGNVGIGTTGPQAALDVRGASDSIYAYRASSDIYGPDFRFRKTRGTIASPTAVLNGDGVGAYTFDGYDGSSFNANTYIQGIVNGTVSSGSVPIDVAFTTDNAERMRIASNGNVGIGTTAPNARLNVQGNGSATIGIGDVCGTNYAGIIMSGQTASSCANYNLLSGSTDQNLYLNRPTGYDIRFRQNNNDQMILANGGNVGIGSTAPINLLDLAGSGGIHIASGVPANTAAALYNNSGTLYWNGSAVGGGGGSSSVQTFTSSGTWTKPGSGNMAFVECWGGGGGGGRHSTSAYAGGGGGGAYVTRIIPLASLGSTETVTIGAGGAGKSTNAAGGAGGNTTFGSWLTAYGGGGGASVGCGIGGGGGGSAGAGSTATVCSSAGTGGAGYASGGTSNASLTFDGGGRGSDDDGYGNCLAPSNSYYGGAGGGGDAGCTGGNSVYGGAGGGGYGKAGGSSTLGGGGGAGAATGTAGSQPGGGGGAATSTSGAGGAGKCRVTVW